MSTRDAVDALKRLGLSNYEARVFVALQRLGTGTAQAISDASEVPRSQVYGAADDLVERGLVELVASSPKEYRPVSLEAARDQLGQRLERERDRAFENLAELRTETDDGDAGGAVATLRGRQPIDDRIADLLRRAEQRVVFVAPDSRSVPTTLAETLRDRARDGVAVVVVTAEPDQRERFADSPVRVFVMDEDNPGDFAGRALMVDQRTVLLSAVTDDAVGEEAMWTADSSIGRILAQFMQSGIDSGMERTDDA
ncbi:MULTISPECIES: TrmB family transcriptional regulator [Halolamina]|uniref:Sugar-specific transcriptional regulator TrmB n=1 Tax=Halolamina pelagica TaxID=699431 RepID=A0A1I5MUZ4_9EURY|nr:MULTISPECIES: helix-turn-helix domain-containing protein [Halolamina]NHX36170.1 TrmB family transcriptional regulator [Halolamina sp. R1-12]SFP13339.1 Sugar-specific transcriptional regulator TrmB [Halolamina pelagica]